jgi:hypothetical protein
MDGLWVDRRPHVTEWLARVRARPNYGPGIEACLSDADRARFDLPRQETWREIEKAVAPRAGVA